MAEDKISYNFFINVENILKCNFSQNMNYDAHLPQPLIYLSLCNVNENAFGSFLFIDIFFLISDAYTSQSE